MKLTKFLPFENHVLTTKLSTLEVLKRIEDNMEPDYANIFAFNRKFAKPYSGHTQGLTFTMRRNINYRNSFLPVISGRIETFSRETEIRIKMRLHSFVAFFASFWLGIVGLVCIGVVIAGLLHFPVVLHDGFSPAALAPFGMFAFGYLLTTLSFKSESKKSLQFLSGLLESEPN